MNEIVIDFRMNEIAYRETTIILTNPYKLSERIRNKKIKIHGDTPQDGDWYQLPNSDAFTLAKSIILKVPYANYKRADIAKAKTLSNSLTEFNFSMSSPSIRLYNVFLEEYNKITK